MNLHKSEEITMEDAILSWFNNVYMPLAVNINKRHILRSFPHRTIGDLYVWIVRYWGDLKTKFGDDVPIEEAVNNFTKKYKIPFYKRFLNRCKSIILRKAIDNAASEPDDKI